MLDEKHIEEVEERIARFLKDKTVVKSSPEFTEFFVKNSINSLEAANLLFRVSSEDKLQEELGLAGFNGYLWVVNAAYYSMFYLVRALLEKSSLKIKTEQSLHIIVFDCLVHYFYLAGKIEKSIVEEFAEAESEAAQTLGREKAKGLVEDYLFERGKRGQFTYGMGEIAMQNKAKTSLERAKRFVQAVRKMVE